MATELEVSDINPGATLAQLSDTAITTWSDEKKKDFVQTFAERAKAARYILEKTSAIVLEKATNRQYISTKHINSYTKDQVWHRDNIAHTLNSSISKELYDPPKNPDGRHYYGSPTTVGGRSIEQLNAIARERAEQILHELPQLKKAVAIIAPDVAKMMERRDAIVEKGNKLTEQLEELAEPLKMSELDQKMTIGQFRALGKDRNKKRKKLVDELNELGEEGSELEDAINKKLYRGLPGLSDAVIKVAVAHKEKSLALDEMNRRVSEKVQFGDSDAALELLRHFEQDEVKINDAIRAEFKEAMVKLQLAGKKAKQLGKGK
jgi:hypothetical protein